MKNSLGVPSFKFRVSSSNLELGTWNLELGTRNLKPETGLLIANVIDYGSLLPDKEFEVWPATWKSKFVQDHAI